MYLLKNCEVYAPKHMGKKDILICGEKVVLIKSDLSAFESHDEIKVISCDDMIAFPGFIDSHVHICGGGGEGGYKTRTPEVKMTELIKAGVTTVIGCLGTDGYGRSMENLVAKAKGLKEEGISAYVYTGSYQVPVRTLTGAIIKDMMMVEEIIGVGEIAIADHRSSHSTIADFAKLMSDARVGGLLSNKSGAVNIHLGDGDSKLNMINTVLEETDLPITQFYPTHVNRNPDIFQEAVKYALKGGYVDFTTSTTPQDIADGEVKASEAIKICMDQGVSKYNMTLSSDAQGSLPYFDETGQLTGLMVGSALSLYESVKEAIVEMGVSIEDAIRVITENPAQILKLSDKGRIAQNVDGDIVLVDKNNYTIQTVFARGTLMYNEGEHLVKDTFI